MKINIGIVGRFHAFDLAKQLSKNEVLNKLITTYPKFKVREWDIANDQIISEVVLEVLNRYKKYIPFFKNTSINTFIQQIHAKKSAKYLNECDIYIGWSGSSLETLIEAKKEGKITILERGSSHYNYQMQVLIEESKIYGCNDYQPDYATWQRELLEYELADYISIPSSYVKRTFLENGIPESKLLVNPYGVDLSMFRQILKEDTVFRIIYAGGFTLQKGSHYLLQAFFELDLPNCELWHLGSVKDEMKNFIEKYKHPNIIFKGHKPQNELYKYYSQGSVFVMPSIQEGMAMVQLQAMACGLPLICSTNTGGDDLITKDGEEGFVIPIRDVEALKEKILYLYQNQDICKEMGQKAKVKVSSGYSWDDYGDRYMANLDQVFGNK
ncbi:MAG: glycosyltransferase family 4 protein [Campylobacterales bacterium]|nr:glycosyltransferase family 4 protein [Campylobacterales bacterium]